MSKAIKVSSIGAFSHQWNKCIESNNSCLIRMTKSVAVFVKSLVFGYTINKNEADTFFSNHRHTNSVFANECARKFSDMDIDMYVEEHYQEHTSLMTAAREGNKKVLKMLLKSAEASSLNEADSLGFTPLHMAAIGNHVECLNLLLEGGADFHKGNNSGYTPLHCVAMEIDTEECGKRLLGITGIDINRGDNSGNTALHCACILGREESLKLLLGNPNIDVDKLNKYNQTPLGKAVVNEEAGCVCLLLDNKKNKVDVNKRSGFHNETPLHHAIKNESAECFNRLLEDDGIDISLVNSDNHTPSYCALLMNTPESNRFFIILKEFKRKHDVKD